ncbi:nucleotide-diphospho-sugar transferase [Aspergillus pseudocaelatus]|uniref:Nucleotide-diphospho-sugar transferase n=1 Tax=Aspergillus pseudocaelatus TaxID=1825620 RepID=A0ABQ6WCI4_9EURO|nr:nucleotide-diphospho-sugar transferase [Aspergillus pseudocaelatus]
MICSSKTCIRSRRLLIFLALIPKIIHQTYKSDTIPSRWLDAQNSCIDMHPDYEYMLWTDKKARAFIATKYPWFLDSFDGYRNAIQRADAIRYFILVYYGGLYIDLDDGCNRQLDKLLIYPAWVRRTTPTGISNDVIGSIPQHPFFLQVIEALKPYDRNWILPYVTIMYTTGPLSLSIIWRQYTLHGPSCTWPVRILSLEDYGLHRNSFFTQYNGSS